MYKKEIIHNLKHITATLYVGNNHFFSYNVILKVVFVIIFYVLSITGYSFYSNTKINKTYD